MNVKVILAQLYIGCKFATLFLYLAEYSPTGFAVEKMRIRGGITMGCNSMKKIEGFQIPSTRSLAYVCMCDIKYCANKA